MAPGEVMGERGQSPQVSAEAADTIRRIFDDIFPEALIGIDVLREVLITLGASEEDANALLSTFSGETIYVDAFLNLILPEAEYDLEDKSSLAKFLVDADIRLVRAEYFYHLRDSNRTLPRRQEAEHERFVSKGIERSALVTHEEVKSWASGDRDAIVVAVSHGWETREQPDPCSFQVANLVNCVSLYDAAYFSEIWLFYDYVSLFQFRRETARQEMSFQRAMQNMHLLYAHQSSLTFRLERLTPDEVWASTKANPMYKVPVFHEPSGCVTPMPLKDLKENRVPYRDRGWCRAELEWSAARSMKGQNVAIDDETEDATKKIPTAPKVFKERLKQLAFTHRKSDEGPVLKIQEKIFHAKVTVRKSLKLDNLSTEDMADLAEALPHYTALEVLKIDKFSAGEAEVQAFGEALKSLRLKRLVVRWAKSAATGDAIAQALAEALKRNTTLTHIDLCGNRIGDVGVQALAEAVRHNSTITHIDLAWGQIGDVGVQALAEAVKHNTALTHITLASNEIGDDGVQALAEAVKHNSTLIYINLDFNAFGDVGVQALAEAVKHNTTLTHISLTSNQIGNVGVQALAEAVKDNAIITHIGLGRNKIGNVGVQALAEAVKHNSTLIHIDLSQNLIGDVGVQALAEAVKHNSTLIHINLNSNQIGDVGVQALAEALKHNTTITDIYLYHNRIGDVGVEALAEAVKHNTTITHISLTSNRIGDVGVQALAEAVEHNTTITHIDLDGNPFGDVGREAEKQIEERLKANRAAKEEVPETHHQDADEGADLFPGRPRIQALADTLKSNSAITSIDLFGCGMGDVEVEALAEAVKHNTTITNIDLRSNQIGDVGMQALAEAVKQNTTLTHISLGGNNIGDVGVQALAEAVKHNTTITDIYLYHNQIGDVGVQALADAVKHNTTLTCIFLDGNRFGDVGREALEQIEERLEANRAAAEAAKQS